DGRGYANGDHHDEIIESLPAHMLLLVPPAPHGRIGVATKSKMGSPALMWLKIRDAPAQWVAALSHRSRWLGGVHVRIEHSGDQGHAHEIGEARSLHLHHEIGPVGLDRSRTDAKVVGNLLVGMASHQSLEDVALAVRQRREPGLDIAAFGLTLLIAIPLFE